MNNPVSQAFLKSLEGLSPRGQLFYYFNLFENKSRQELALNLSAYFYELAINNNLIGCYNKISNLISIYCNKSSHKEPGDLAIARKDVESNYFKEMNNLKKEIQDVKNKVIIILFRKEIRDWLVYTIKSPRWQLNMESMRNRKII